MVFTEDKAILNINSKDYIFTKKVKMLYTTPKRKDRFMNFSL